jgi:hypothetical protein
MPLLKTKSEQRLSQLVYIIHDGFTHYSEDGIVMTLVVK